MYNIYSKKKKEKFMNIKITIENQATIKTPQLNNYVDMIESTYKRKINENEFEINIGDIIRIGYLIPEGNKERTQYYEGLVIAKKNRGLGKTFTIRRNVQGIGVEQGFLFNSPKITSIVRKQASKVRRAKLYFIRALSGKATRLKAKI